MFFKGLLDGNINGFPSLDLDWFLFGLDHWLFQDIKSTGFSATLDLVGFSGLEDKEMVLNVLLLPFGG